MDANAYLTQLLLELSEITYTKVLARGRDSTAISFVLSVKKLQAERMYIYSPIINSLYPELFQFKWKGTVSKVRAIFQYALVFTYDADAAYLMDLTMHFF